MTYFLREVFERACAFTNKITQAFENAYLYTGYTMWRATNDPNFLAMTPAAIDSPLLKQAAGVFDIAKNHAQRSIGDNIVKTIRAGDFGPKPDIKPGLINIVQTLTPHLSRTNWSHPIMMASVAIILGFVAYAATHAGNGHGLSDTIASLYGTTNGQRPKSPTP